MSDTSIRRLGRYIAGSYPPVTSTLFALAWSFGVSGLYAIVDPRGGAWRPGADTAIAALTLALDLLLMRIVDDIRDRDYDRANDPARPLPRGVVAIPELLAAYLAVAVLLVALNAGQPGAGFLIAQLVYALAMLFTHEWLGWPSGDRLVLTLLISCPAQILLHLYLYSRYLARVGHGPDAWGLLALVIVLATTTHLEAAKKIVRVPLPGERTYVRDFGLGGTVGIAMFSALGASALLLAAIVSRWSAAGCVLLLAPLALPFSAYLRFLRPEPRWRAKYAAYYVLASFAAYAAGGLWLATSAVA
ncbi:MULTISPECIES: hypothetical protein [unclassified Burkholderia]|uniref:hypothetical protein n=1 Tax=unclassified Burkholderia TaxID=2613784 RepID=UPI0014217913|nr:MULTISPECIES: hypothetical protein [unclassified Burkholderia]NIE82523.1 hypothetical protein [Burkholderia sp. Tr-860]NIF61300.1 hypothetical protein [Burkholderia sp. Cy-647]NIF94505.1 hypothetical protein [Burkholderia sp. Ax-1720]